MPQVLHRFALFCALALLAAAGAARAETTDVRFSVRLLGVKVGEMTLAGQDGPAGYSARAAFATKGLVGAVARVGFDMRANGTGSGAALHPLRYQGDINTGRDRRATSLQFARADTHLDPMSALWIGLRDRAPGEGCALDREIFDGKTRQRIRMRETARDADVLTCSGILERIAGYSAEDLAESRGFPLSVTYALVAGRLRAERAVVKSLHGPVTLLRR